MTYLVVRLLLRLNPCFNGRYSQRFNAFKKLIKESSLNPCFNGRYSQSTLERLRTHRNGCLNPCFNGRYSQSEIILDKITQSGGVLILVLMEDTLRGRLAFTS